MAGKESTIQAQPAADGKQVSKEDVDQLELVEDISGQGNTQEKNSRAPEIIRNLSPDDRERLETNLRRKIDLRLMPMVVTMYILNYLDRNNIAAARLAGLERDLHLHGNQFQVILSILASGTKLTLRIGLREHFVCWLFIDARYSTLPSYGLALKTF